MTNFDLLTRLQMVLATCCLFLLLRLLEGRCDSNTNSCIGCKTGKNAVDGAAEDEQLSCLLKEEDVELESQRVEQIDATSNNEVVPFYKYSIALKLELSKSSSLKLQLLVFISCYVT